MKFQLVVSKQSYSWYIRCENVLPWTINTFS